MTSSQRGLSAAKSGPERRGRGRSRMSRSLSSRRAARIARP